MKNLPQSRGPEVDTEKCVDVAGGNRYNLVLIAAVRAREIARQQRADSHVEHSNNIVSALFDVQNGKVGIEYLRKIK